MGWLEAAWEGAHAVPAVAEVLDAGELGYHGTTALLDLATGDTEGASEHGGEALGAAAGLVPYLDTVMHGYHAGAAIDAAMSDD